MCISKTSALQRGLVYLSSLMMQYLFLGTAFADTTHPTTAIPPNPAVGATVTHVIDNPYPTPSRIALPNGTTIDMTIGTLADMQKKADIKEFEDQVEQIFYPKKDKNLLGGLPFGAIPNGAVMTLPAAQSDANKKKEKPQAIVKMVKVLSVYGRGHQLHAELSTEQGLIDIGPGANVTNDLFVSNILKDGVMFNYKKKNPHFVQVGEAISYTEEIK